MKRPSKRQVAALALVNQGVPMGEAMIRAGYSEKTARTPTQKLIKAKGFIGAVEQLQSNLYDEGLTTTYIAKKLKQFIDAKKTDKADYKTQIEGLKIAKDIILPKETKQTENVKRRLTIEEFLDEPTQSLD